MITSVIQYFYPDLRKDEMRKFSLLALAFFFTIGSYWLLRLLKDLVIFKLAFPEALGWPMGYGKSMVPYIKGASPFVVAFMVVVYTKLIDMFEKHKLFYVIGTFYAILFAVMSAALYICDTFGAQVIGKYPLMILGIGGYLATESMGSLLVALFWSFTASSVKTEEAKRGYPLIIAAAQIGAVGGSSLMLVPAFPAYILYALSFCFMFGIMYTIHYLVTTTPKEQMTSDKEEKKSKPNFFAGLQLLFKHPYLMGVFVVSTFYEVAKTIVDLQMKSLADIADSITFMGYTLDFKQFLGVYGVCTNALAFFVALLGLEYIIKRFGLRVCLMLFPIVFGIALVSLYAFYITQNPSAETLLWATFGVMITVAATSYAVNNPIKEMMYIPTSKDAKFKAKGIVDMAGSRFSKASGSVINGFLDVPGNPAAAIVNSMMYGTLMGLGIVGLWALAAIYVGNKYNQLIKNNEIIE